MSENCNKRTVDEESGEEFEEVYPELVLKSALLHYVLAMVPLGVLVPALVMWAPSSLDPDMRTGLAMACTAVSVWF